ncbi:branched-chain amino acid ABC transporter permease [Alcaligenaceae bacterium CGII-47]|nr:branched-chain amino acid ABC transporter permease [Alcaligenaceae bacterium CGII-47]
MENFVQQLIYGLSVGSTYALIALAITLAFRGMDVINFAQGEFFMAGAFMGYVFHVDLGMSMWLTMLLSMITAFCLGSILERVFLRKLEKNVNGLSLLVMTIALFIILRSVAQLIFGSSAYRFPAITEHVVHFAGVQISAQYLIVIMTTFIVMVLLYLLFTKTSLGLLLRAVAQDKTTSRMMGINVSRINNVTFGLCSLLGAVAGIVYAPIAILIFDMGHLIILKGFTAALLGGLGLVSGAVLGGFTLGVIEQYGTLLLASAYKDLVSFSILLLIILIRPNGLLGKKQIQKV